VGARLWGPTVGARLWASGCAVPVRWTEKVLCLEIMTDQCPPACPARLAARRTSVRV